MNATDLSHTLNRELFVFICTEKQEKIQPQMAQIAADKAKCISICGHLRHLRLITLLRDFLRALSALWLILLSHSSWLRAFVVNPVLFFIRGHPLYLWRHLFAFPPRLRGEP